MENTERPEVHALAVVLHAGGPSEQSCRGQLDSPDPIPVDLNRDRALEQCHRHNQPVKIAIAPQNAFQASQGTFHDPYLFAHLDRGEGFRRQTGFNDGSNRFNLERLHRLRAATETHDIEYARCLQYRQAVIGVKSAERITREKGLCYFLDSVRPTLFCRKKRQELLITFRAKSLGDALFVAWLDVQRKPRLRVAIRRVFGVYFDYLMSWTALGRRGIKARLTAENDRKSLSESRFRSDSG